jgi:transcriptional accessory protein Tex/SPT6
MEDRENGEIKRLLELLKNEIKRVEELVELLDLYVAYEEVSKEVEELAKDWDVTVSDGLDDE